MKYDKIESLFEDLDFDIHEPPKGHQQRFLQKLKEQEPAPKGKLRALYMPVMAIAASVLLAVMVTGISLNSGIFSSSADLANVSPELTETQQFYSSVIKSELAKLEAAKSPETEAVINDALAQLEKLDKDYEKLKKDLRTSGQDKRVIFAMISNFQQRIDLLNDVLSRIETINELKNPQYENTYL